jgi:lambda repressor-like predicted transcriptional regulator
MPPKRKIKPRSEGMKSKISDRSFAAKNRAFHVIARMRHDGVSLRDAAREENTTPATVKKLLPAALRRYKSAQWIATKSDRYVRPLSLPGPHGPVMVQARGSKEAQLASAYLASLSRWRRSEKAYELAPFHGKKIGGFTLVTASRTLRALRDTGMLQLDSLYASVKGTL